MANIQVSMLRNVSEERSLSIKLYADRLTDGLRDYCTVKSFHPWSPPFNQRPGLELVEKGVGYAARYGVYPPSLLRQRADVFHIVDHTNSHLLSCLPSCRTVVTCHDIMLLKLAQGDFDKDIPLPLFASKMFALSLRFLKNAALVIAVSEATADDLVKFTDIPRGRIRVIHHGIDPQFGPPPNAKSRIEARARWNLDGQSILLHVGNNWFYKNLEGLIKALASLQSQGTESNHVLLKVGKRLTVEQRRLATSLGVADRIREVGVLSGEELQSIYWASDVLVFPSLWEGFGWPPLEAMASGTPVVCSDRGSLKEVAGDAAQIVDPEEPDAIAEGITKVIQNKQLGESLTIKGLARAKQFTWERSAEMTYRVYQEVAG